MGDLVNRYLKDKDFDHMDHALGRPVDPMGESYRNYFATEEGDLAARFRASPWWEHASTVNGMLYFRVTPAGRAALRDHLREIGDPHRLYSVSYGGDTSTHVAKSRGEARYLCWLDVSDCCPDLKFGDFMRACSVRLA